MKAVSRNCKVVFALAVATGLAACTGTVDSDKTGGDSSGGAGGESGSGGNQSGGQSTQPNPTDCKNADDCPAAAFVMRRLTREEYDNTVSDMLGAPLTPAQSFPVEEKVKGFDNNGSALSFPGVLAEQSLAASAQLAKAAAAKASTWNSCASGGGSTDCARKVIEGFGRRAWRRPLAAEEIDRLMGVFEKGETFLEGIEMAAQSLLISVPFFYRVERVGDKARTATSWEMASRLSYLIWKSLPDEELFAAAADNKLTTEAQIAAQAQRMLSDGKAKRTFAAFNKQWLELSKISTAAKDPKTFPKWNNDYADLLRKGAEAFAAHVAAEGKVSDLFTAGYVFVNDDLAPYYGASKPGSTAFKKVELDDPKRRAGILTQGGMLASHSGFNSTSPTFTGRYIREQLLCGTLPPPPPDVNVMIGLAPPDQTTREHHTAHNNNPQCTGCHRLMDPIGFAFEEYDAMGQHRTTEHGKPIDATGEAVDTDLGKFTGVTELAQKLVNSDDAAACWAKQWFRFAFGRLETSGDEAAVQALKTSLRKEGTFRELLLQTTKSRLFAEVPAAGG